MNSFTLLTFVVAMIGYVSAQGSTAELIAAAWSSGLDLDGDNKVSRAEFDVIVQNNKGCKALGDENAALARGKAVIDDLVKDADTNGDGDLSEPEIRAWLIGGTKGVPNAHENFADYSTTSMDNNNNRKITHDEQEDLLNNDWKMNLSEVEVTAQFLGFAQLVGNVALGATPTGSLTQEVALDSVKTKITPVSRKLSAAFTTLIPYRNAVVSSPAA